MYVSSNVPMNKLEYNGATRVPIAVPLRCSVYGLIVYEKIIL